jgi:hypothetical protein
MALDFKNPWGKGGRLAEDWLRSFKSNFGVGNDTDNELTGGLQYALPFILLNYKSWDANLNSDQLEGLSSINSLLTDQDAVFITSKTVLSSVIDYTSPEGKADLLRRVNLAQTRANNVRALFSIETVTQKPREGWDTDLTVTNITKELIEQSQEIIISNVSRVEVQVIYNGTSNTRLKSIKEKIDHSKW